MELEINSPINSGINRVALPKAILTPTDDFAEVLKQFGLKYKRTDYYLEVGEAPWIQGWILDISVVVSQLLSLQEVVIPFLAEQGISFKIARSARKATSILTGEFGPMLLGKVLSIYPPNEKSVLELSKKLIEMTQGFKGPEILTDRRLGGVIYARYGAGKAVIRTDELP